MVCQTLQDPRRSRTCGGHRNPDSDARGAEPDPGGQDHQIYSAMQAGQQYRMHTLDQHLAKLVRGAGSPETGLDKCHHTPDYNKLCGRS